MMRFQRQRSAKSKAPQEEQQVRRYFDHDAGDSLTALHLMCKKGTAHEAVHTIVSRRPSLVSKTTLMSGDTPLHFAVAAHDEITVKYLLDKSPEVAQIRSSMNGLFGNQFTPLHVAINSGASEEIIKALVEAWPRCLRIKDGFGRSPYSLALECYHTHSRGRVLLCLSRRDSLSGQLLTRTIAAAKAA